MTAKISLSGLKKIKPVQTGSVIGVIATGSPCSPERYQLGVKTLEQLGFEVRSPFDPSAEYGKHRYGFAAESTATRLKAFHDLIDQSDVDAILAVRGAYGTMDILPGIDFRRVAQSRKAIIGCSDVTALLAQVATKSGIVAIHGATLASSFADYSTDIEAKDSVDGLLAMLSRPDHHWQESVKMLRGGNGSGPIIAANLTMLMSLLGTPWDFDYSDAILVIEDVGEAPYRVHRAFTQLRYAGKLDKLQGLVFGRFARCESKSGPSIDEVFDKIVSEILLESKYPVAKGLSVGHYGRNMPLGWGVKGELLEGRFRLLESPIE